MSREDFYEAIRQKVLEYLPASEAERRAEIHTITKNNGVTRQALCIFGESVIVPNIYLEDYYKQHLLGRGTEDILGEIALVYQQGIRDGEKIAPSEFQYGEVKDRLFVAVCNAEKNRELLEEIPHEMREDLALVYRAYYDFGEKGNASVLIKNQHLKAWGIEEDTLKTEAWQNMHRILPPTVESMNRLCMELARKFYTEEEAEQLEREISPNDMTVLSNGGKYLGAAYMFDGKLMGELAEKLGDNLIILPSSVNEVLLRPEKGERLEKLKQMVEDVNDSVVSEVEILSDEIYRYDWEKQTLSMISHRELLSGILPDRQVEISDMYDYGYTWEGMLPLTRGRALELMDCGLSVFRLGRDGTEGMLGSREEIYAHDGLFGVEKEEWVSYLESQSQTQAGGMIQDVG